jgi:hypothetical protein
LAPGLAQVLVNQVLEHRVAALEAVGADVGEVVRDGVQLGLLGFHPVLLIQSERIMATPPREFGFHD